MYSCSSRELFRAGAPWYGRLEEYLLKLEKEQKDECKLLLTRAECQKKVKLNERSLPSFRC